MIKWFFNLISHTLYLSSRFSLWAQLSIILLVLCKNPKPYFVISCLFKCIYAKYWTLGRAYFSSSLSRMDGYNRHWFFKLIIEYVHKYGGRFNLNALSLELLNDFKLYIYQKIQLHGCALNMLFIDKSHTLSLT